MAADGEDVVKELKARREWMEAEMGPTKHDPHTTARDEPPEPPLSPPVGPVCGLLNDVGPVGAWGIGRTEWNPTSGLTGVRQAVDRHSVTRYSPADWARQLDELIAGATRARERADRVASSSRDARRRTTTEIDALHRESSDQLQERAQTVWRWQSELQRAAEAIWAETQVLNEVPPRLNRMLAVLKRVSLVTSECIAIRCRRPEPDLVHDPAHEELVKEAALANEVSALVSRCLAQAKEQIKADLAALHALQADWGCKSDCYRVDTLARSITAHQRPLLGMFHPGAVLLPDGQVTPVGWEQATRTNIARSEAERARSLAFRNLLHPLLDDAVRDVRAQGVRVDDAVARNVALMADAIQDLEAQLKQTLHREVSTEIVMDELRVALRQTEPNLKTAQGRLHVRKDRVPQENCRDVPQAGLLVEVARVSSAATTLEGEFRSANDALHEIREERARLEAMIVLKKRTLHLDRERVFKIREHFPSAGVLSGMN